MGSCLGKKKRSESREQSPVQLQGQPRVSLWVENSDFSSVPDLEQFGEKVDGTYHPESLAVSVLQDGYSTAPEDLSEEEEQQPAPVNSLNDKDSRLSSEYMTSDEAEMTIKEEDFSWKEAIVRTLEAEEDDSIAAPLNREDIPLAGMATPVQKQLLSPRIIEALADQKGRLKKNRVQRYLQLRQESIG